MTVDILDEDSKGNPTKVAVSNGNIEVEDVMEVVRGAVPDVIDEHSIQRGVRVEAKGGDIKVRHDYSKGRVDVTLSMSPEEMTNSVVTGLKAQFGSGSGSTGRGNTRSEEVAIILKDGERQLRPGIVAQRGEEKGKWEVLRDGLTLSEATEMLDEDIDVGGEVRYPESEAGPVTDNEFRTDIGAGNGDDVAAVITVYDDGTYEMENKKGGHGEEGQFDIIVAGLEMEPDTLIPFVITDDDFIPSSSFTQNFSEMITEFITNRGIR